MMRWIKHQRPRDTSFFEKSWSIVFSTDESLVHQADQGRFLDVEVDEFDRIMSDVRYTLHFWWNKLDESGVHASEPVVYTHNHMLLEKLEEVDYILQQIADDGVYYDIHVITLLRMKAMDVLKDIRSILDPVIKGCSLAREVEMIARPNDLDEIARLLVFDDSSTNPGSPVSVFPIIGMPGSGKTSLIYFLFHHHLLKHHFDHRIWIHWKYISGIRSGEEILMFVKHSFHRIPSIDYDAKHMIVVEDLSNEGGKKWFELLQPLLSAFANCKKGTKIIVTYRSTSLDSDVLQQLPLVKDEPFSLKPLYLDALPFFKSIAFRNLAEQDINAHLNDLALAIFHKCANNLRVIRYVALILSSQPPPRWKYVNEVLLNMSNPDIHISEILDVIQKPKLLNYFSLLSHYEFSKVEFYQLWSALEDLTEPFKVMYDTLLNNKYLYRCSKKDKSGVNLYYKVHDLVLELIKHFPCYKCYVVENLAKGVERIRHVCLIVDSYWGGQLEYYYTKPARLKSLFFSTRKSCGTITIRNLNHILEFETYLVVLDLAIVDCRDVNTMNSITKRNRPLRYLRLGVSPKCLPECITNLVLLQTLDLRHYLVQQLPEGFHKLLSLRHLYIGDRLIDLPPKFGELTELQTLDVFIVGHNNGLDALANLTHLAGNLKIRYQKGREVQELLEETTILQDKKLHELTLERLSSNPESGVEGNHQNNGLDTVDEVLLLPSTLKILTVRNWKTQKFPQLAIDHLSSLFSNLVSIHIADISQCKHLPCFSKLGCLKSLELWGLIALEWIEISGDNMVSAELEIYFPSLEHLSLLNLPQLKGWSSKMEKQHASCSTLAALSDFSVSNCPELLALPLMPNLKSLEANNFQGDFLQQFLSAHASQVSSPSATKAQPILQRLHSMNLTNMSIPECLECLTTLEELSLCWLYNLRNLPESIGRLIQLRRLAIRYVPNLADLPESLAGLSALEHVELRYCPRLKQVPEYFNDLKSLRRLEIKECVNLEKRCQQPNGEDWPHIQHIAEIKVG